MSNTRFSFLADGRSRGHPGHIDRDGNRARDMQVLMLIEDRESTRAVSADQLRDAMFLIMHARIVCHEGHVLDALAIYDGIAQSITPQPALSGRSRPIEVQ